MDYSWIHFEHIWIQSGTMWEQFFLIRTIHKIYINRYSFERGPHSSTNTCLMHNTYHGDHGGNPAGSLLGNHYGNLAGSVLGDRGVGKSAIRL